MAALPGSMTGKVTESRQGQQKLEGRIKLGSCPLEMKSAYYSARHKDIETDYNFRT